MGSSLVQGELWGKRATEWADRQEKMHRPLYEGVLSALAPIRGKSLLDVGCGSGMFLEMAYDGGAVVSGIDASKGLLDIARKRVPTATLAVADLEALPFEQGAFDVVTAFNSVQYAADPRKALAELARVCNSNGRVVIGQWADSARCQTDKLFAALRQLAAPPPGTPAPLALSGAGQLESHMVENHLVPSAWGEALSPFEYASLEDAWLAQASAGPLARVIDIAGEERTRATVIDAFRDGLQPDGSVRHVNFFRWVIARPM